MISKVKSLILSCLFLGVFISGLSRYLSVLDAPWNWIRLYRTYALAHGIPIYQTDGSGPLVNVIYGPVSFWVYLPAILARTAAGAVAAGLGLTTLLYFLPAVWFFALKREHAGASFQYRAFALALFGLFTYAVQPLTLCVTTIHADTPSLFFFAVGLLLLSAAFRDRRDGLWLFWPWLFIFLAVWSRQQLILAAAFVLLYTGWAAGSRWMYRSALAALCAGGVLSLVIVAGYGPRDLWTQLWVIPSNHFKPQDRWLFVIARGTVYFLKQAAPLILVLVGSISLWSSSVSREKIEESLKKRPDFMILATGLFMVPSAVVSQLKWGAGINHFAFSMYFILLAALSWALEAAHSPIPAARRVSRVYLWVLAVMLLAISATREVYQLKAEWASTRKASWIHEVAAKTETDLKDTYFPELALEYAYSTGRFYHDLWGYMDWKCAGFEEPKRPDPYLPDRPRIAFAYNASDGGFWCFRMKKSRPQLPSGYDYDAPQTDSRAPGFIFFPRTAAGSADTSQAA